MVTEAPSSSRHAHACVRKLSLVEGVTMEASSRNEIITPGSRHAAQDPISRPTYQFHSGATAMACFERHSSAAGSGDWHDHGP
jgi:hypothetical protein